MSKATEPAPPQLCLLRHCPAHAADAAWSRPSPSPRPVYAAGSRLAS